MQMYVNYFDRYVKADDELPDCRYPALRPQEGHHRRADAPRGRQHLRVEVSALSCHRSRSLPSSWRWCGGRLRGVMGGVVSEGWVGGEGRDPDGAGLALDVPVGYRRTEVGVIPEDWEARSLRSTLAESPSYGINAPAVPFDGSLPTYIRITDIGSDGRFRPTPRVSVNGAHATSFFLKPGDLVFARTGASVGKSYLYDRRDGPLVFAGFLIRLTPDPRRLRPAFIAYYVQTRRYWRWIANNSRPKRTTRHQFQGVRFAANTRPSRRRTTSHRRRPLRR